jgi:hypothetical protein
MIPIKKIFGYIILLLHEILPIIAITLLIVSNNIIIINIILILLLLTLYQWYIFNDCLIYPISDWFIGKSINNEINTLEDYYLFSFFGKRLKILKVITNSYHLYINFILIFFAIFKLNYAYYKIMNDK